MKASTVAILTAAGAGLIYLLNRSKRNEEKNENKKTNNTIAQNTLESEQAQIFYKNFNIEKTLGKYHVNLTSQYPNNEQLTNIFNAASKIVNLKGVQNAFSTLTANQLTLNSVTSECLNEYEYKEFWKYAKEKKVVTIADTQITLLMPPVPIPIKKNTVVGTYVGEYNKNGVIYYYYTNDFTVNASRNFLTLKHTAVELNPNKQIILKDKCKLVTP